MLAQAIEGGGPIGQWVMAAALACCLVAIADVIVNDLMPDRFCFRIARAYRHLGFMGISLALGAMGVLIVFEFGYSPSLFLFWLNSAIAVLVAFLDVFARHRTATA